MHGTWEEIEESNVSFRTDTEPGCFASSVTSGELSEQIGRVIAEVSTANGVRRWSTAVVGGQEIIQVQSTAGESTSAKCLSSHRKHYVTDLADLAAMGESTLPAPTDVDSRHPGPITGHGQVLVAAQGRMNVYNVQVGEEETVLRHFDGSTAREIPKQATPAMLARLGLEPAETGDHPNFDVSTLQELSSLVTDSEMTLLAISWDREEGHKGGAILRSANGVETFVLKAESSPGPNTIVNCQLDQQGLVDPGALWVNWMSPPVGPHTSAG